MKDCPTTKEERETEQIQQIFSLDKGQTSLKMLATDIYDSLDKINSLGDITLTQEQLNLRIVGKNGKNDPTAFLPLNADIVGQVRYEKQKYKDNKYLTEDEARHINTKVESGNIIDINTLKKK